MACEAFELSASQIDTIAQQFGRSNVMFFCEI